MSLEFYNKHKVDIVYRVALFEDVECSYEDESKLDTLVKYLFRYYIVKI